MAMAWITDTSARAHIGAVFELEVVGQGVPGLEHSAQKALGAGLGRECHGRGVYPRRRAVTAAAVSTGPLIPRSKPAMRWGSATSGGTPTGPGVKDGENEGASIISREDLSTTVSAESLSDSLEPDHSRVLATCYTNLVYYTVSQKNVLTLKRYSSKLQGAILMKFGRNIQNTLE